jgi:hypothetical protein
LGQLTGTAQRLSEALATRRWGFNRDRRMLWRHVWLSGRDRISEINGAQGKAV